jgi:hypothetical protein
LATNTPFVNNISVSAAINAQPLSPECFFFLQLSIQEMPH